MISGVVQLQPSGVVQLQPRIAKMGQDFQRNKAYLRNHFILESEQTHIVTL